MGFFWYQIVGNPFAISESTNIIVPIFEEKGQFMLGIVFSIQSIFGDQNNKLRQQYFVPQKKILFP